MAPALSAKSFVLDLLSTLRRGAMPVQVLVEAAALFGIAEGSVRVALTRALAAGLVERDERGRYRLGEASRAVRERVAEWRRLESRVGAWSGAWIAVVGRRRPPSRAAQRRSERALRLLGFRELERGLALRPENLAGGVAGAREQLAALGLAPGALVCELRDLDPVSEARARGLWDAKAIAAAHRRVRKALVASARRLPGLAEADAMVESFRLGGEALRLLAHDPLLPEPIFAADERAALVDAMRRYDALGRASWAGFLARHGVLQRAAPADTSGVARGGLA
jgi:phenylacetic acid degradation operon negative regulatory protein